MDVREKKGFSFNKYFDLFKKKIENITRKTIRGRIFLLVIIVVVVSAVGMGVANFVLSERLLLDTIKKNMQLQTSAYTNQLMGRINRTEKMSEGVANLLYNNLPENPEDLWASREATIEYVTRMEKTAMAVASDNEENVLVFLRLNPQYFRPTDGFYLQQKPGQNVVTSLPVTDFSEHGITDAEVEWFYKPLSTHESMWVPSVQNHNPEKKLMSYVVPLIKDDYGIGVVGIDITIESINELIESIHICNGDYALLLSPDDTLLSSSELPMDFNANQIDDTTLSILEQSKGKVFSEPIILKCEGTKYLVYSQMLQNGMKVIVAAPEKELLKEMWKLPLTIAFIAVFIGIIVIFVAKGFINRIIGPLLSLTESAEAIAEGRYNTIIEVKSDDEIGMLACTMQKMSAELNKYVNYMKRMAYMDPMTGIKNRSAYNEYMQECEEMIKSPNKKLVFIYMDVNDLKCVNDTLGHEKGDEMLVDTASLIRGAFGDFSTFRIGGDEFVAILQDEEAEREEKLIKRFKGDIQMHNSQNHSYGRLSIAIGVSIYHDGDSLDDLFTRADEKMYSDKRKYKNARYSDY